MNLGERQCLQEIAGMGPHQLAGSGSSIEELFRSRYDRWKESERGQFRLKTFVADSHFQQSSQKFNLFKVYLIRNSGKLRELFNIFSFFSVVCKCRTLTQYS